MPGRLSPFICAFLLALSPGISSAGDEISDHLMMVMFGEDEDFQEILDGDFEINTRDEQGRTLLMRLAGSSMADQEVIDRAGLLIQHGSRIEARDESGRKALHLAARSGTTEYFELLLQADADINARDEDGNTPLHWAVYSRDAEAIRTLLDEGADGSLRNLYGETPFDFITSEETEHKLKADGVYWELNDARFE